MKNTLIIGGTSGLGLELAKQFKTSSQVFVTGRTDPKLDGIHFLPLELHDGDIYQNFSQVLHQVGTIDTLVIAAGFFQSGTIGQLSEMQIDQMLQVGLTSPIKIIKAVLEYQEKLNNLLIITSTSQFIPRKMEPIYTTIKAGMGMLGASLSQDEAISKVFVVAPAGMKTPFWKNTNNDQSNYLDPVAVAQEIQKQMEENFTYRYTQIHRNPFEIRIIENRDEQKTS